MPSEGTNRPQRKNWRESSKAPGRGSTGKSKDAHWVKQTSDGARAAAVLWFKVKVGLWSLLFVGLLAALIYKLIMWPMQTTFVACIATKYQAPIPPNGWAKEDSERLQLLKPAKIIDFQSVDVPEMTASHSFDAFKENWFAGIREKIATVDPQSWEFARLHTVILYLNMHGVVNDKGESCLIPPGASPLKSNQWVPVRELLKNVFLPDKDPKSPAEKILEKIRTWDKLVILDCCRIDSNWGMGQFYNRFAEGLASAVKDADVPNLYVLNSAGAGEVSWTAPEMGGSVFGYYLAKGLSGEADENHKLTVSLRKLTGYLQKNVLNWVRDHRGDIQKPMLLPENAPDIALVKFGKVDAPEPTPKPDDQWTKLGDLWIEHAKLYKKEKYREKPLEWESFQVNLLRAEQLLEAGEAYKGNFNDCYSNLTSELKVLQEEPSPPHAEAFSFPLAKLCQGLPSDEELGKLSKPWDPPPAAKPGEKPSDKPVAVPYDYLPAAMAAWQRSLEHCEKKEIENALEFVNRAQPRPVTNNGGGPSNADRKPDVVQIQFLRMLNSYLDPDVWSNPSDILKQALKAREKAEQASTPQELESQYWIRKLVDDTDQDRRLAEDELFIASKESLAKSKTLYEKVGNNYDKALNQAAMVKKALAVRDQDLAEGPYLARCFMSRLAVEGYDAQAVHELIESTGSLSSILDAGTSNEKWPDDLRDATDKVDKSLKNLKDLLHTKCSDLSDTKAKVVANLRPMMAVLGTPLISGDERITLRKNYLEIMFSKDRVEPKSQQDRDEKNKERGEENKVVKDWKKRLADWKLIDKHPALMLLDFAAGGTHDKKTKTVPEYPEQEQEFRQQIEDLPGLLSSTDRNPEKEPLHDSYCHAERTLRASAALLAESSESDKIQVDPIAYLHQLDFRSLLLWHVQRTCKDFWGPIKGTEKPYSIERPYYFEKVASDYLGQLEKTATAKSAEADELKRLIAVADKEKGVYPTVNPKYLRSDDPQTMTVHLAAGLPPGEAAVYLENSLGQLLPTRRQDLTAWRRTGVTVKLDGGSQEIPEYLINKDGESGKDWRAVSFYRGHIRTMDFFIGPLKGVQVAYEPKPPLTPQIVVRGDQKNPPRFMFILDCSGSMKNFINDHGSNTMKFEVAKRELLNVLGEMSMKGGDDSCIVGMMAYGHRYYEYNGNPTYDDNGTTKTDPRFAKFKAGEILERDPVKTNEFVVVNDPDAKPDQDIEVMKTADGSAMALLDKARLSQMDGWIKKLKYMGSTPLYRSIIKAADESGDRSQRRQIIVLTDGVNELEHDDKKDNSLDTAEGLRKVLDADKNIRLDIVGFHLGEDAEKAEFKKMTDLCESMKERVKFHNTNDTDALRRELLKSLEDGKIKYEVVHESTKTEIEPSLPLNKPCVIRDFSPGEAFLVKVVSPSPLASTGVVVEGGEYFDLTLRQYPWSLVHDRYLEHLPNNGDYSVDVTDSGPLNHGRKCWIAAQIPENSNGDVRFRVSVQNGDKELFSPHPREAWMEITPQPIPTDPDKPKKYVFYDITFQDGMPVPVLECVAQHWPERVNEAQIELWCKFSNTDETTEILGNHLQGARFPLAVAPGVELTWKVEPGKSENGAGSTTIVVEEHYPKGADIYQLKLNLEERAEVTKILRRFDANQGDEGIVRHEFWMRKNPSVVDIMSYKLRIATQKKLKEDAVTTGKKLHVVIPPK